MGDSFDQHCAHKPKDSPTAERQAGHSGGSAISSVRRKGARIARPMRARVPRVAVSTVPGKVITLR
jgi:hypothetical protein